MKIKNPFKFIKKYVKIFRESGFKGLIKEGGWKLVIYFFLYYLIRDTILYIIIPYLVVKGVIF
tara:strand:+ start:432 stop:620 length:189 start_codon:yes stop_codon:yes gene_type:complete